MAKVLSRLIAALILALVLGACGSDDSGAPGGMGMAGDCSGVTPGNGGFGDACRSDADCDEGLPCCIDTGVSAACGRDVNFCECI